MLPQNDQLNTHQQVNPSAFTPQTAAFEAAPYFSLDPSSAAKQMAALSATNKIRISQSRVPAALPLSGTNSGSFLGGTNTNNQTATHDTLSVSASAQPSLQLPNSHGMPSSSPTNPQTPDSAMSQVNPAVRAMQQQQQNNPAMQKQRQMGFLQGLATLMAKRGNPLPPALTGIQVPNYDHASEMWQIIEPSGEVGSFRLAGKDVSLFKLWGLVFQLGGGAVLNAKNAWSTLLPHFDLPEETISPQIGSPQPVATLLSHHYHLLLQQFEDVYKQNMQDNQKRVQMTMRQGQGQPSIPNQPPHARSIQANGPQQTQRMGAMNPMLSVSQTVIGGLASSSNSNAPYPQPAQTPQPQRPGSSLNNAAVDISQPVITNVLDSISQTSQPDGTADQDVQRIKRKLDPDDEENKRARQKTGSEPPDNLTPGRPTTNNSTPTIAGAPTSTNAVNVNRPLRPQPSRRKIEYVPYARELDTHGGRDLKIVEAETASIPQRRPIRDINDWGAVDIEALTMSIRSRLSTELSYALATFTLLSTMRGQQPGTGFPIHTCPDLFDELLDLLEEQSFGDSDVPDISMNDEVSQHLFTNHELVNFVSEEEALPFAVIENHQGSWLLDAGPVQNPNHIILTVLNIIRNLSLIQENQDHLARTHRLIDLLTRLCVVTVKGDFPPRSISPVLSLGNVIVVRKNVVQTLNNIGEKLNLASLENPAKLARRLMVLIASYLIDPSDSVSPFQWFQMNGGSMNPNPRPPPLADLALEALTRLAQQDSNREVIAHSVPSMLLGKLLSSLAHRLPVVDADFQLVAREAWLGYLERTIISLYSIAFLSPPELKTKVKLDKKLGLKHIMFRMIQKFILSSNADSRTWFAICARRAIETMKVLDDGQDMFDASNNTALPPLSFGMGYGETGDLGAEKGTGIFADHRDVAWEMLLMPQVFSDEVMFGELESLARVE